MTVNRVSKESLLLVSSLIGFVPSVAFVALHPLHCVSDVSYVRTLRPLRCMRCVVWKPHFNIYRSAVVQF